MPKTLENGPIPEKNLSSGDIARYCHTGVTQVNRWIKNGDLKAFKNPGGHYRITKKDFKKFLELHNMPVVKEFFERINKKVLIADDSENVVYAIKEILESRYDSIEIKTAYDGYTALLTAGDFKPDLIILDIRMPEINGLEICHRIRENENIYPNIKILAITAHAKAYDKDMVLEAGANDYLLKPVDMKTLLEHVDKML